MALSSSQMLQERYRIVSLLARGGMGAVYHAWDTRLSTSVAIKEMMPQSGTDLDILAQSDHPNSAPEESPPTPLRGFGKIWCNYADVRSGLGWATDYERGFYATAQDFEQGIIFRTDNAETFVLYGDRTWNSW